METNNTSSFNQNEIPLKWGIIIAIVNVILFTVLNKFVMGKDQMTLYYIGLVIAFIVAIILLFISAKQQRTAMGGYITFKECFRGLFISILIVCIAAFMYQFIYMKFIDPSFMERMKESTLYFTEKMGASQEQLDATAEKLDKQIAESNSISRQLLSAVWAVLLYSIISFIICAIVKKKKPLFEEDNSQQQFQH